MIIYTSDLYVLLQYNFSSIWCFVYAQVPPMFLHMSFRKIFLIIFLLASATLPFSLSHRQHFLTQICLSSWFFSELRLAWWWIHKSIWIDTQCCRCWSMSKSCTLTNPTSDRFLAPFIIVVLFSRWKGPFFVLLRFLLSSFSCGKILHPHSLFIYAAPYYFFVPTTILYFLPVFLCQHQIPNTKYQIPQHLAMIKIIEQIHQFWGSFL
jgi:hypothetical protein